MVSIMRDIPVLMFVGCFTDDSGERLNGIQEVCGSIPHISTKKEVSERISLFLHFDPPYLPGEGAHG